MCETDGEHGTRDDIEQPYAIRSLPWFVVGMW